VKPMTFEEFVREEEEREKKRREAKLGAEQKRLAEDTQRIKAVQVAEQLAKQRAEQLALRKRIMDDAQRTFIERNKKVYDLAQPPNNPESWLVFDRATGELYGESTKLRAYQAWSEVNPTKLVHEPGAKEPHLVVVGFNACRCVLRSEWEAAEAQLRKRRMNGAAK